MTSADKMQRDVVESIRQFVAREIAPVASQLEHADEYPTEIVERMKELGLFGCNVGAEYGGLGLDTTTFAMIVEEISRGWMSAVGPIGTHSVICDILQRFGTEAQRRAFLPGLASGERRGGLALSEADAGTDVQRITTTATRGTATRLCWPPRPTRAPTRPTAGSRRLSSRRGAMGLRSRAISTSSATGAWKPASWRFTISTSRPRT
jgi:alkylation response protein AidB-like acyl-CoA dehydrogenase